MTKDYLLHEWGIKAKAILRAYKDFERIYLPAV